MEENHKITRTLRAHHGLLDEVKTTLLSICERLSTPHFKSISDTLLAPKHVVALILALSKDLAEWVTDHHELIVQQSQVVQHNRILEAHEALVRQAKQMAEKQKYLEFENDIYRRMFMEPENPKDIAQLRIAGLARPNSSHTREAEPRALMLPVSRLRQARDHEVGTKATTNKKVHVGSNSSRSDNKETRSTDGGRHTEAARAAEVNSVPSSSLAVDVQQTDTAQEETHDWDSTESDKGPMRDASGQPTKDLDKADNMISPLTKLPDIMSFAAPAGSRGGNRTFIYEFSDTVLFKPNPLYPPHSGKIVSGVEPGTSVTATCPGKPNIRVSLSADHDALVQRPSPTRLVYPAADINVSHPNGKMRTKLGLPLPMTLEELHDGATKEVVVFRTDANTEGSERKQITLDIRVNRGINAGQEIQATVELSQGHAKCTIVFKIYEIEHPVFSRDRADLSIVYIGGRDIILESLRITTIDGRRHWLSWNEMLIGAQAQKGMPMAVTGMEVSRGHLRIIEI